MQKIIRWWRYSMGLFFFLLLIGFCMAKYNYIGGQFFGNAITYYLGLVMMLIGWLIIEICLAKPKFKKIFIPASVTLVIISTILINGYIGFVSGIILAVIISMHYLIEKKLNMEGSNPQKTKKNKKDNIENVEMKVQANG